MISDNPLNDERAAPCPFCGKACMYLEYDTYFSIAEKKQVVNYRIGAFCDEWSDIFDSPQNDTMGNDFGRTQWHGSKDLALSAWNIDAVESAKVNHVGFW